MRAKRTKERNTIPTPQTTPTGRRRCTLYSHNVLSHNAVNTAVYLSRKARCALKVGTNVFEVATVVGISRTMEISLHVQAHRVRTEYYSSGVVASDRTTIVVVLVRRGTAPWQLALCVSFQDSTFGFAPCLCFVFRLIRPAFSSYNAQLSQLTYSMCHVVHLLCRTGLQLYGDCLSDWCTACTAPIFHIHSHREMQCRIVLHSRAMSRHWTYDRTVRGTV